MRTYKTIGVALVCIMFAKLVYADLQADTHGVQYSQKGVNFLFDPVVASGVKTSNSTTAVAIAAAGASGTKVYLAKLFAYNVSTTVSHTVSVISSGGNVLAEFTLSSGSSTLAGGNAVIDDEGAIQSVVNEGISFKIDAGGTSTDVKVTAVTVTK